MEKQKPKYYFAIYYHNPAKDPNHSFYRAAKNWAGSISNATVKLIPIKYMKDLITSFSTINLEAKKEGRKIAGGAIFSHGHLYIGGKKTVAPLAFPQEPPKSWGELQRKETRIVMGLDTDYLIPQLKGGLLERLDWEKDAILKIVSCNSGHGENSLAQHFANSQNVTTTGEMGFASFSTSPSKWAEIDRGEKLSERVFLKAFHGASNLLLTTKYDKAVKPGLFELLDAIPEKTFVPNKR